MSATTFAGSAQFAVASILGVGGGIASAIVAATLLNARYAPISVSVAPIFVGGRLRRLFESQLIVDESWALSRRPDGRHDRRLLVGAGLVLYACWVGGTAIGAFAGDALGDPASLGPRRRFPGALPRPPRPAGSLATGTRRRRARRNDRPRPPPRRPGGRPDRRGGGGVSHRLETTVSDVWIVIAIVGAATIALKAVGPVLLGGKPLPKHLTGVVALLAPALLAALVVTQVAGGDEEIVLDARLVGLGAAIVALLMRAPLLVVVVCRSRGHGVRAPDCLNPP